MEAKELRKFKPTPEQIEATKAVFMAMAYVETIRPIVQKYQREILEQIDARNRETGKPIRREFDTYLMTEEQFNEYLKLVHEQHLKHGFKVEYGYCPLLTAENTLIQAQNALLKAMQPFTKIDPSELYNLVHHLDIRRKLIDLTLRFMAQFV